LIRVEQRTDLHSVEAESLGNIKETVAHQQMIGKLNDTQRNEDCLMIQILQNLT